MQKILNFFGLHRRVTSTSQGESKLGFHTPVTGPGFQIARLKEEIEGLNSALLEIISQSKS